MSRRGRPASRRGGLLLLLLLFARQPAEAQAAGLEIVSQPGVQVVWEGVELGVTGETGALEIGGIPPGTYSVTLSKSGYETLSLPLVIRPGTTTISLRLEPLAPPPPAAAAPPPAPAPAPAVALPEPEPGPAPAPPPEPAGEATVPPPPPPAEQPPSAVASEPAPRRLPALLLLAMALAAAALWLLVRARRAAPAPVAGVVADGAEGAGRRPPADVSPAAESSASRELLEELQRREMARDGGDAPARARRRPEVIEIREFKVIEDDS